MRVFIHTFGFVLAVILTIALHSQGNMLWAIAAILAIINGLAALAQALRPHGFMNRRGPALTLREQRENARRART